MVGRSRRVGVTQSSSAIRANPATNQGFRRASSKDQLPTGRPGRRIWPLSRRVLAQSRENIEMSDQGSSHTQSYNNDLAFPRDRSRSRKQTAFSYLRKRALSTFACRVPGLYSVLCKEPGANGCGGGVIESGPAFSLLGTRLGSSVVSGSDNQWLQGGPSFSKPRLCTSSKFPRAKDLSGLLECLRF
jgi:hypothetical protein